MRQRHRKPIATPSTNGVARRTDDNATLAYIRFSLTWQFKLQNSVNSGKVIALGRLSKDDRLSVRGNTPQR